MTETRIRASREGAVATLRIDRPEARNALSRDMFEQLRLGIAGFGADRSVRALMITGSGESFCSGADLADPMMGRHLPLEDQPAACRETLDGLMNALVRDIRSAPFPVVAAVNGVAAGGGVGLALAADFVVAADEASFMLPFVPRLGLVPDLGATWHAAHLLGRARAMGMLLLGEALEARRAAELGVIWRSVPRDDLMATATELAARLASGPRSAQIRTRELIDAAFGNDLSRQLTAEAEAQASLVAGEDVAEAMAAFAEKRKPNFSGR